MKLDGETFPEVAELLEERMLATAGQNAACASSKGRQNGAAGRRTGARGAGARGPSG